MSAKNKNRKKNSLKKFDVKIDGVKIISARMFILLLVIPTIITGFFWISNAKYKSNVADLQNKLYKQENKINELNSKVIDLTTDLSKKQIELENLKKQVNSYIVLNSNLSLKQRDFQNSILKNILAMQKSIYAMNNQIKLIKKSLQPNKQAQKNK